MLSYVMLHYLLGMLPTVNEHLHIGHSIYVAEILLWEFQLMICSISITSYTVTDIT